MIAMVFLLIGANLLFTCFSFQGNATDISSEIVNVPVLTQFVLTISVQIAKRYLTFFQNAANRCLLYRICCLYYIYIVLFPNRKQIRKLQISI